MMQVSEWVPKPGEAVVEVANLHSWSRKTFYEETTVERVLKRDIVLANGNRYRKPTPFTRVVGGVGNIFRLIPADSAEAQEFKRLYGVEQEQGRVRILIDKAQGAARKGEWSETAGLLKRALESAERLA